MLNAFIYDGLRTPIGRHAGKLSTVRPDDLAAGVIAEVVKRNGVKPEQISDVILGCVTQPRMTSEICSGFTPLRLTTSAITPAARSSGRTEESFPA